MIATMIVKNNAFVYNQRTGEKLVVSLGRASSSMTPTSE